MRKGYLFLLDAIIALMVLVVGILLIFTITHKRQEADQSLFFTEDILGKFSRYTVKEINDPFCGGGNSTLIASGNVSDSDNTLLEQLVELYYRNKTYGVNLTGSENDTAWNCTDTLLPLVNLRETNFELTLIDGDLDPVMLYVNNITKGIGDADVIIPTRKIVQLNINQTLIGPYVVEVMVWQ